MTAQRLVIRAMKHDGTIHRTWLSTWVFDSDPSIALIPPKSLVQESNGKTWDQEFPVVVYFHPTFWFNVFVLFRPDGTAYYCNMASPPRVERDVISFIDYDLDVFVHPDRHYDVLDQEEFVLHSKTLQYTTDIVKQAENGLQVLTTWIDQQKGPFAKDFYRWKDICVQVGQEER